MRVTRDGGRNERASYRLDLPTPNEVDGAPEEAQSPSTRTRSAGADPMSHHLQLRRCREQIWRLTARHSAAPHRPACRRAASANRLVSRAATIRPSSVCLNRRRADDFFQGQSVPRTIAMPSSANVRSIQNAGWPLPMFCMITCAASDGVRNREKPRALSWPVGQPHVDRAVVDRAAKCLEVVAQDRDRNSNEDCPVRTVLVRPRLRPASRCGVHSTSTYQARHARFIIRETRVIRTG